MEERDDARNSRKMKSAGEDKDHDHDQDHAHVVVPPPVILGIVLVAGWLLNRFSPLGVMNDPGALLKTAGSLLFVTSGVIMVSTSMLMASKKTALRPDRQTTTIVTSGFFKYSRNPLYLSLMLILLGIALYSNSLWLLILLPVLLLALARAVILREERYLERAFGQEYLQYKNDVRRWI